MAKKTGGASDAPPTNRQLHEMILKLEARVDRLSEQMHARTGRAWMERLFTDRFGAEQRRLHALIMHAQRLLLLLREKELATEDEIRAVTAREEG